MDPLLKTIKPSRVSEIQKAGQKTGLGKGDCADDRSVAYFAKTIFAVCALAREAAFLCTTPDFTALSIAEV